MKQLLSLLMILGCLSMCLPEVTAQDERPAYLILTTVHWNWDHPDGSQERWLELETEYHEKVTMKNEHIMGAGTYYHFFSEDNSELMLSSLYKSWADIEAAGKKTDELEEAAWPDEAERDAFMKERNAYYSGDHSDEIYSTLPHAKPIMEASEEPLVFYIMSVNLSFPEDGSNEEFAALDEEFHTNVTHKNTHLKGYYQNRHAWGSNGREVMRAYVVESLGDVEAMLNEQNELIKAHWPDEEARKDFMKKYNRYFTPQHSDRMYQHEPKLVK